MITDIQVPFEQTPIPAHYAIPDTPGKHGSILLIHEVWGVTNHMKSVAQRLQQEGYAVLLPDLFANTDVSAQTNQELFQQVQNPQSRDEAQQQLRATLAPINVPAFAEQTIQKLQACFSYLHGQENSNGKIGVIGFCFGGTYAYALATVQPQLKAAVPFYGHSPEPLSKVEKITCPVLAFYGGLDKPLMDQLPELKDAMILYHKQFLAVEYPDCQHAFFNDTNPTTYNKEAADDAWGRMIEFLKINLS